MTAAFARATNNPNVKTVILAGMWPLDDADNFARYERFEAIPPYSGSTSTPDLFRYGLQRAVALLLAAGKHVIVLGDVPRWRFDVGQVALTKANTVRSILAPWLWSRLPDAFPDRPGLDLVYGRSAENSKFFQSLAQQKSVLYIDLFQRFCSDDSCAYERDGNIAFIDTGHLSDVGARYALQDLHLP